VDLFRAYFSRGNKWLGTGLGSDSSATMLRITGSEISVHNQFFHLATLLGWPLAVTVAGVILWQVLQLSRNLRAGAYGAEQQMRIGLLAAQVGALVATLANSNSYYHFAICSALIAALDRRSRTEVSAERLVQQPSQQSTRVAVRSRNRTLC
jgi:O-antigen ligase